ncbi:major head protein [Cyanophage SS120-1]|uniref:Major capsid protein n=2 Tax=Caudoviricetes TaxID=2731619 RepID=M1U3C5_9CAUD|nr:major head protein [Cyanophage SS120-1]AGG54538.1 major capsid protein [Cyanophage SS120-1]
MTNIANLHRPNSVNGNQSNAFADKYATALKLFSGEVFTAFNSASIFKGLVRSYTLRGGKSKQFLLTGTLSAGYHTPGQPILGDTALKSNEVTINADDLLVSSQFVYSLDEVLSQYSTRSEISKQIGEALAKHYDVRIARVLDIASRKASVVTGEPGGFEVSIGANNEYKAQKIVDGLFEAAAVLDERNAPQEGRVCVLNPRQYLGLISAVDTNILNRELGASQGDINSGKGLYSIAGIRLYKSNNLPFKAAYNTTVTGENNDYADANATCCGLVFHKEAAGVVETLGPSIETTSGDFGVQYQGDLIVGKLSMGAGSLRVSVAGSLQAQ